MELASDGFICSGKSEAVVMADPASETFEPRRVRLGRVPDGNEGVRECLISMRVARETGWISGTLLRKANVLTCTDLQSARSHGLAVGRSIPVGTLRRDVLVQRIPSDTLYVMRVLAQRKDTFA